MFDQKKLPATPSTARKLCELAKFSRLHLDDLVLDLANQDRVTADEFDNLPLDDADLTVLQRVVDWKGRGIILGLGRERTRRIAVASLKSLESETFLILTKPAEYVAWALLARKHWPQANISVFGNPRYLKKSQDLLEGVKVTETPDHTADIIITSYGSVIWHNLLDRFKPTRTIVEEIESTRSITYHWEDVINGLFGELPAPLFLQDIQLLLGKNTDEILPDAKIQLRDFHSAANQFIFERLVPMVLGGLPSAYNNLGGTNADRRQYLNDRGYAGLDPVSLYPVLGISSELIAETDQIILLPDRRPLTITNKDHLAQNFARLNQAEVDLFQNSPAARRDLAQRAVSGDSAAQTTIASLRTPNWATIKASKIKDIIQKLGGSLSKYLIVADTPALVRALALNLASGQDNFRTSSVLTGSSNPDAVVARYLYPDPAYKPYAVGLDVDTKTLDMIILPITGLTNIDLIKKANFVIMAEWPLDQATFDVVREDYLIPNNCQVVGTSLAGTIESDLELALTFTS